MKFQFREFSDRVEFMIGDIRDYDRLEEAMDGMHMVIHGAAMKQVGACEEHPNECYKTNVLGTQHVIKAIKHSNVSRALFISSDKAVEPVSVYGNSKQAGEKLFLKASEHSKICSIVRLGNLLGSSGSVVPLFSQLKATGVLPITDPGITRFCGGLQQGAEAVLYGLEKMRGGEIFIPKWKAFKITDLASAVAPNCRHEIIGLRKFEKMHEKLVGDKEITCLYENAAFYLILGSDISINAALDAYQSIPVESQGYSSDAVDTLTEESITTLLANKNSLVV